MLSQTPRTTAGLLMSGLLLTGACTAPDRSTVDEQAAAAEMTGTATQERRPDAAIATEIQSRFYDEDDIRGRRIGVRVQEGRVALDGTVADESARERAVSLAQDVDGVLGIDNRIEVAAADTATPTPRTSTAPLEARDRTMPGATEVNAGWITTKIQSQYFIDDQVRARRVDVTTTDTGNVTLEGEVESEAASRRATEIARATDGVRAVDNRLRVVGDDDARPRPMGDDRQSPVAATAPREGTPGGDGWVTMKIQAKYFLDGDVAGRRIDVDTSNGRVTLTGEVRSEAERRQAVAVARNTDGVLNVDDRLRVVPDQDATRGTARASDRSAGEVLDDTWVTTKIQAKYFLDDEVKGRRVDVTARDGVVTLTGAVTSDAARRTAEAIARETEGVTRVANRLTVVPDADYTDDTDPSGPADRRR